MSFEKESVLEKESVHASENIILQTFLVRNKCKGTIKFIIIVNYVHKIYNNSHVNNITDILGNVYFLSVKNSYQYPAKGRNTR